jgi:signal transduction histidine kinase
MDLRNHNGEPWDFSKMGSVKLNGDWDFYWNEFRLEMEEDPNRKTIPVPYQWQRLGYPAYGYATYHAKVILYGVTDLSSLAVSITEVGTSYQFYINHKLICSNGVVGKSESESIPFMKYQIIPLEGLPNSDELDITILVSNYHYPKSGLWNYIQIGDKQNIYHEKQRNLIIQIIVLSSISIMGLYHIILFFHRRNIVSTLVFGIFCLSSVLRDISINERYILDLFPDLPFLLVHRIEFFTFSLGAYLFALFVHSLFPDEFSEIFLKLLGIVLIPCSLITLICQMSLYGKILPFVQIVVVSEILYIVVILVIATIRKRVGAKLFLLGWILFSIAIVNDILKTMYILQTPELASYGLLIFVMFQATIISRKFSIAFIEMERLSVELKSLTENLERKVHERTLRLEDAMIELEKFAESRKRLSAIGEMVSAIVHDIKNPMATIKSFAELACEQDIEEEQRKEYLDLVVREIDRLSDLTYDILDFSKGRIHLDLSPVHLEEFQKEIYHFLKFDFDQSQIKFQIESNWNGVVNLDKERMRRVLINLANNAREAMSGVNKNYQFTIKFQKIGDKLQIDVIDNGPGISPEVVDKIFKPFSSEGKAKGTGLGLFMSKWIIEQHGGNLTYKTFIGEGTTFTLLIPI